MLGRAFAEQTAELLPASIAAHGRNEWASLDFCNRRLAVSSWDRSRVWQDILSRVSEPPYTGQLTHAATIKLCEEKIGALKSRVDAEAPEQTRQLYKQALAMAPTDGFLHFNFAQYLAARGELAQATEEAQHVCELLPQRPAQYYDIGNLLILQGRIDEAADYFSRALAIQGDFAHALNGLGQIRANEQKTGEAVACFRHALRSDPGDADTWLNLGFLEQNRGNLKQAAAYYQHAARLQPQGPADYFNQAVDASALGLRARAVELFGEIIQLKPEFWQAHYLLGLELAAQGRIEEARAQFRDAVRYRPDFAGAHLNLGLMLAKQEQPERALAEFRITLQLDPSNQSAHQYLETIQAAKGRGPAGDLK